MSIKKVAILLIASLLLSACGGAATTNTPAAEPTVAETGHTSQVHWTYEGAEGPDHWGDIDPAYAACGTGKSQSPIDLHSASAEDLANIAFHYQASDLRILNNGHTVQVNYDAGSYIEVDGERYDVAQFHYHAPSEHSIDGQLFPAELHIVHKNAAGQLAVVGILLTEGAENPAFQPFLSNLPDHEAEESDAGVKIDAAAFLPATQTTYRYSGSLTTPPCSEGVSWFVMDHPVELSADQIAALETVFEGNNRPVQPINERSLIEDTTP